MTAEQLSGFRRSFVELALTLDDVAYLRSLGEKGARGQYAIGQQWFWDFAKRIEVTVHTIAQLTKERDALQGEISDAFDAIFAYVPEARAETGEELSVASKISRMAVELERAESALAKARNEALEEAINVAKGFCGDVSTHGTCRYCLVADAILALKKPEGQ